MSSVAVVIDALKVKLAGFNCDGFVDLNFYAKIYMKDYFVEFVYYFGLYRKYE